MRGNGRWMKWLAILVTAVILVVIYMHVDRRLLVHYIAHVNPGYFALALLLFVPQILVTSFRWKIMTTRICPMGLSQSVEQVMASKALNALVPSKLGEMSKAYFLSRSSGTGVEQAVPAVILEKVLDMGGLCTVLMVGIFIVPERNAVLWLGFLVAGGCLAAVAFLLLVPLKTLGERLVSWNPRLKYPARLLIGWGDLLAGWKQMGDILPRILGLSVLLWILHVLQIYLFFPSLNHPMALAPAMAFIPMSILVGLLPITLGGMGTRDSALIFLFAPYADSALMVGVGILCSMRYWVDTMLGVPFFHRYTSRLDAVQ